jgi:hypothetical protein
MNKANTIYNDNDQEYDYDQERETPQTDWYEEYGHKRGDF